MVSALKSFSEETSVFGLVVLACVGIGPVLKLVIQHFLTNKVKHSQELDSVRILEEKSKLRERDETLDFFKTYLEKKDKEYEHLRDQMSNLLRAVQDNQFTDKKDFQTMIFNKLELLLLKFEDSMSSIIERNHITKEKIDITYKKLSNIVDRDLNELRISISDIHYHNAVKVQVTNVIVSKRECMIELYKEVITDYAESSLDKAERKDLAFKSLKECTSYLQNTITALIQKTLD